MAVFTCCQGRTDTVLKPGIVKAVAYLHLTTAVGHRYIITTAEFVQQVGFGINKAFTADLLADIETDTANCALDAALIYFDTIAGNVVIAAKIAQSKLRLRLDIPAILQVVFASVFSTQRYARIVKIAGDLLAVGVINSKIIVHIADLKHQIQIMAFAADLRIVEADRFIAVIAAAAAVAAAAVGVADGSPLITCLVLSTLYRLIVAQLISSIFVFKPELPSRPILLPFTLNQAPLAASPL